MQSLFRQLENFANSPHATYRQFLSASAPDFYAPLLHVDLPAPLRLIAYLRGLNLLSEPQEFSSELQLLVLQFQNENARFLRLRDALCMRRFLRDVETQIDLDVQRLFTGESFFAHAYTRRAVSALARTFCCLRSFCVYKQGIHEIFAIAYLISYAGCEGPSAAAGMGCRSVSSSGAFGEAVYSPGGAAAAAAASSTGASLSAHLALLTPENAPAYAYFIGVALMRFLMPLYADAADALDIARRFGASVIDSKILRVARGMKCCNSLLAEQIDEQDSEDANDTSDDDLEFMAQIYAEQSYALEFLYTKKYTVVPMLESAQSAIFERLRRADPALAERLAVLRLENVFFLRWLRLAFLREVELPRVPRLWDFLIYGCATTRTAYFLIDFAATLLCEMREQLMSLDYTALMRYFSMPALQAADLAQICRLAREALRSDVCVQMESQRLPLPYLAQYTDSIKLMAAFNAAAAAELARAAKAQDLKRVREVAALLQVVHPGNAREFQRGIQAQEQTTLIPYGEAFAIVCRDLVRAMRNIEPQNYVEQTDDKREVSE